MHEERMESGSRGGLALLLALVYLPALVSAQSATAYSTLPADRRVAVGEAAVFRCGVSPSLSELTLTLHSGSRNHSLSCPGPPVDNIPQALYGSCKDENGESLATWTVSGTSFSDNGTRVVCRRPGHPAAPAATLTVYDDGTSTATIVGCAIGGFFGTLLVVGLSYTMFKRPDTLQRCCRGRGRGREDDTVTIVSKE